MLGRGTTPAVLGAALARRAHGIGRAVVSAPAVNGHVVVAAIATTTVASATTARATVRGAGGARLAVVARAVATPRRGGPAARQLVVSTGGVPSAVDALVNGDETVAVAADGVDDTRHLFHRLRDSVVSEVEDGARVQLVQAGDDSVVHTPGILPIDGVEVPIHCTHPFPRDRVSCQRHFCLRNAHHHAPGR